MDLRVLTVMALLTLAMHTHVSDAKPISLVERCWCRTTVAMPQRNIRELRFLNTPNCSFQVIAKLKKNNREVCIDPKTKWLQQYLKNALEKIKAKKQSN
ncbi:stromal cell-derived factor 1-like [Anguilla rostrata]|nr:chemokine (C-X-C motif) ligand 12a (stromal cell-derived factor 1) [Anguilla anguilla]